MDASSTTKAIATDSHQPPGTPALVREPHEMPNLVEALGALHPATADLVTRFATALARKLADAEQKYGYTDNWRRADWMPECRAQLRDHLLKGDPRDAAAYCAFLWAHEAPTHVPGEELDTNPTFQSRAGVWLRACLGDHDTEDLNQTRHRFLEASLRLIAAAGGSRESVSLPAEQIFANDGASLEPAVGRVLISLSALCSQQHIPMMECAERELDRAWTAMGEFRAQRESNQAVASSG